MNYCEFRGGLDGQRENVRWKCGGPRFYNAAAAVRRAVKNDCHAVAQRWRRARKVGSIPKGLPSIHYPYLGDYCLPVADNYTLLSANSAE